MALDSRPTLQGLASLTLILGAGALIAACATGAPEDTAEPLPPSDGGLGGDDSGSQEGSSGSGGSGGTAGTGGTGATGGTGGTAGAPTGGTQCESCMDPNDCQDGFTCATAPDGTTFCAADCTSGTCPSGDYECVDLSTYGPTDSDAGTSLSGNACVPTGGKGCPCTAAREGQVQPCFKTNASGTCEGVETCHSGGWVGCDAPAASAEICDGIDNNCNGATDMDEPGLTGNDLCAGGSAPPHSSFTCVSGNCELAGCDPGWARYPTTLQPTAGCACGVDDEDIAPASNDLCTAAVALANLPDVNGSPLLLEGTLSSDTDEDWYSFNTVDSNQVPAANSYRVHVEFLSPDGNPGDEFLFDVIRGPAATTCDDSALKAALTTYDWCADSSDAASKADDDQSAPMRIRVYRNTAATGTCKLYKIRVTNGGSGACPPDDGCSP